MYLCLCCSALEIHAQTHNLLEGRRVILADSLFRSGSSEVIASKAVYLDSIGAMMAQNAELAVEIDGFADNQGNAKTNLQLSDNRALGVKKYLGSKFGIVPERMSTKGFGSASPIGDNATEAGRATNRRVEIVPVTPLTKRPVISVYNVPINAEGKISFLEREVSTKPPWSPLFSDAYLNQPVYELHKIHTLSDSRTVVTFNDLSEMKIGGNTMIVIYGTPLSDYRVGRKENISLMTGGLLAKLRSLSPGRKFVVKTPSASIAMNEQTRSKLGVDPDERSMVSVFEGNAEVGAQDTTVRVPEGFGTDVKKGSPPAPPRPLPRVPERVVPAGDSAVLANGAVQFRWKSETNRVRLEIAPDTSFNSVTFSDVAEGAAASPALAKGEYYYRLIALSPEGLESPPERMYHLLVIDSIRAFLSVTRPKEHLIRVDNSAYTLVGSVEPGSKVLLNGRRVTARIDGTFMEHVDLVEGDNVYVFSVQDGRGGFAESTYVIHRNIPEAKVKVSAAVTPIAALVNLASYKQGIAYSFSAAYILSPKLSAGAGIMLGQAPVKSSAPTGLSNADVNLFDVFVENIVWRHDEYGIALTGGVGAFRWAVPGAASASKFEHYTLAIPVGAAFKYNTDPVAFSFGAQYLGLFGDSWGFDPASTGSAHGILLLGAGVDVFLK